MPKLESTLALLLVAALGCATETGERFGVASGHPANLDDGAPLAVPARGFQVQTAGSYIEPGDDLRLCEVVALPGGPDDLYHVTRIESALSAYGEDLVVSVALAGSQTEAIMDVGAVVPCTRAGEAFGEELSPVMVSQESYEDLRFPAGVGKVLHGGQKLAIEYHYVNESSEPVPAKARLSFHAADAGEIVHVARTASFGNFTIYTPPGGHSSHLGECTVDEEMMVSSLLRRTQRFATDFRVWRVGRDEGEQLIWQSGRADARRRELSDEPLHLLPGDALRFECNYRNTTERELRYGVSATDETCILDATFFSIDGVESERERDATCWLIEVATDGIARE